jgi:hypothetical protein
VLASLIRGDALAARGLAEQADVAASDDGAAAAGATVASRDAASGQELLGRAASGLMALEPAARYLENARSLWYSEGDLDSVARCHASSATLMMRGVGDLNVAGHHIREAEELPLATGSIGLKQRRAPTHFTGPWTSSRRWPLGPRWSSESPSRHWA